MSVRSAALACCCLCGATAAAQTSAGLALYGETTAPREAGVFALPAAQRPYPFRSGMAEVFARHVEDGTVLEWAGEWRSDERRAPRAQGRINELYVDFAAAGLDFTAGKKVLGSGVGYGFRPLDVIQREERRALFETRLEGVPLLAAERINGDTALSLIYLNRAAVDTGDIERGPHEAVLRWYRLAGDAELHALVHLHERLGPAPGAGFTWVHGSGMELHGAALYQPRFTRPVRESSLLAAQDPWYDAEARADGKVMLGVSWTAESGYSLLAEAWHDGEAMSARDWRRLRQLATAQQALFGSAPTEAIYGNIAWDLRAYERASPVQDNVLVRLAYDGERGDPHLDLLVAPDDAGYVATLGVAYELAQGLTVSGGVRRFGGPDDSVYATVPLSDVAFLEISGEMVW